MVFGGEGIHLREGVGAGGNFVNEFSCGGGWEGVKVNLEIDVYCASEIGFGGGRIAVGNGGLGFATWSSEF